MTPVALDYKTFCDLTELVAQVIADKDLVAVIESRLAAPGVIARLSAELEHAGVKRVVTNHNAAIMEERILAVVARAGGVADTAMAVQPCRTFTPADFRTFCERVASNPVLTRHALPGNHSGTVTEFESRGRPFVLVEVGGPRPHSVVATPTWFNEHYPKSAPAVKVETYEGPANRGRLEALVRRARASSSEARRTLRAIYDHLTHDHDCARRVIDTAECDCIKADIATVIT